MSSSSETPKTQESKPQTETLEQPKSQHTQQDQEGEGEEEEEDGEGECPFCLYMKAGACKETFVEWEKCIEEGEKNKEDIVNKCFEATAALQKCMQANPDHYGPILQAEKAAEQQTIDELEKEKELEQREKESASAASASGNKEKQSESS